MAICAALRGDHVVTPQIIRGTPIAAGLNAPKRWEAPKWSRRDA